MFKYNVVLKLQRSAAREAADAKPLFGRDVLPAS